MSLPTTLPDVIKHAIRRLLVGNKTDDTGPPKYKYNSS